MHFSPFLAGPCLEWKWGQKATDLRRHRFAGARHTLVNAEEENGNREKEEEKRKVQERRRERKKREAIRDITKKKKKQTQKHELTLREMQKKRKHQFWIDEETFHTKTVIKEPASRELCAVGTRFNKK